MATSAVEKIGNEIARLTDEELQELYSWLDQYHPQPIDRHLAVDLAGGRIDRAIFVALHDESRGRTQRLS